VGRSPARVGDADLSQPPTTATCGNGGVARNSPRWPWSRDSSWRPQHHPALGAPGPPQTLARSCLAGLDGPSPCRESQLCTGLSGRGESAPKTELNGSGAKSRKGSEIMSDKATS
jgi:hypothetical protein